MLSPENRMPGGNLNATLSCLKGGCREDKDRLFPEVYSKRMSSNRQVTAKEIPIGHGKGICHHQGCQTQKTIAQRGGKPPDLEPIAVF